MRKQKGFTLLETTVVVAVIGILATIVTVTTVTVVGGSKTKALDDERGGIEKAVGSFAVEIRKGPDASNQWGLGTAGTFYPTEDGKVGDIELSTDTFDPANSENPRVDKYASGPSTGGAAVDADITASLIWIGLLVNEAYGTTPGTENTTTGDAHALDGETGQYLGAFPSSAAEANTDTDATATNGNGHTDGSYHWVLLQDGKSVPVYKSGTAWYSGSNGGAYP